MKLKHAVAALSGLLAATTAHAGYAVGTVGQVVVGRNGNQVFIELQQATFTSWPCATIHPNGFRYSFLLNTDTAKAMLATVLMAQATGQNLQVQGHGTCNVDSSLEDVHYVTLRP